MNRTVQQDVVVLSGVFSVCFVFLDGLVFTLSLERENVMQDRVIPTVETSPLPFALLPFQ